MVSIDRDVPLFFSPDLRDWVRDDDMVHFVIQCVEAMRLPSLKYNRTGSGSRQYPPKTMLMLLIYSYANGIFSSRRIEAATYNFVPIRFLMADTHPDHDTIATFRRENLDVVAEAFVQVLQMARELGILKVGTVSVDGTHLSANASLQRNVQYDRAVELDMQLEAEVQQQLRQAEAIDASETDDGQRLPEAIASRQKLQAQLRDAQQRLKQRARAKHEQDVAKYAEKQAIFERRKAEGAVRGRPPKRPPDEPPPSSSKQRCNLTDPDSRAIRKSTSAASRQAYNAQAAVDADGSMLILSTHVTNTPADFGQLDVAVANIDESLGKPKAVVADGGYSKVESFDNMKAQGIEAYVAVSHEHNRPSSAHALQVPYRIAHNTKRRLRDPGMIAMDAKMRTPEAKRQYRKRQTSVEPVFGIIRHVIGFNRFALRGMRKVAGEWSLVALAYNMKRVHRLMHAR